MLVIQRTNLSPSCLQATIASRTPQPSPQATPQGPRSNLIRAKSDKLLKLSLLWDVPHLHSSFRRGPPSDQAYIHVLANGGHGQLGHRSCGGGSGGAWWVGLAFNSCSLNTLTIVFAPPVKSAFLQCHISNLSRLIFV